MGPLMTDWNRVQLSKVQNSGVEEHTMVDKLRFFTQVLIRRARENRELVEKILVLLIDKYGLTNAAFMPAFTEGTYMRQNVLKIHISAIWSDMHQWYTVHHPKSMETVCYYGRESLKVK